MKLKWKMGPNVFLVFVKSDLSNRFCSFTWRSRSQCDLSISHIGPIGKALLFPSFRLAGNWRILSAIRTFLFCVKIVHVFSIFFFFSRKVGLLLWVWGCWTVKNADLVCISTGLVSLRLWISAYCLRLTLWITLGEVFSLSMISVFPLAK